MAKTIIVKKASDFKKVQVVLNKGLTAPFKNARSMFLQLGTMIDRDTVLTFKGQGKYLDRRKWKGYARSTMEKLKTYPGLGKIRYGTDLRGRPGMQGRFRGKGIRRYDRNSKLLQASGGFRQSFRILKVGSKKMVFGTRHKLAGKIGTDPLRQVLHYTNTDKRRYGNLITNWWSKKIKF
jgi:hypothetical protein